MPAPAASRRPRRHSSGAIALTRDLAFASGIDAANRAMRTRLGRHLGSPARWSAAEADIATETTNRLLLYVPFEQGGLQGLDLTPSMRSELGISEETWCRAKGASELGHNGGPALDERAAA